MVTKGQKQTNNAGHKLSKLPVVAVVGLGYVGFPLAIAFSKHIKVIGFDTNTEKVRSINSKTENKKFHATDDPKFLKEANFIIIAVPTPITKSKEPDLSYIISAAKIVSQNMNQGCTVILESTVYPGVTEEVVKPILEESGLRCGKDFKLAYSPERISPGDEEHSIDKIVKVVGGIDADTTEKIAELYRKIFLDVFQARNIKTAEASKVVENTQRDLNIALVNELSVIFNAIGLNINDVLDAATSKWNFSRYSPGLVGGHCIPVVPYFLVHKAKEIGYYPQVILAARSANDYMPTYVAQQMVIKGLNEVSKVIKGSKILIMGLTYKENVPDTREAPVKDMIKVLKEYGTEIYAYDPLLDDIESEFDVQEVVNIRNLKAIDCVVLTVGHNVFRQLSLIDLRKIVNRNPLLVDIRGFYDATEAKRLGYLYKTL